MTENQKVIEQALTRLYQRINLPTASDKIHYRAALAAVRGSGAPQKPSGGQQQTQAPNTPPNPLEGATVAQVQALVEQGKVTAAKALAYESGSEFPRKTLIGWLESFEEDGDDK